MFKVQLAHSIELRGNSMPPYPREPETTVGRTHHAARPPNHAAQMLSDRRWDPTNR